MDAHVKDGQLYVQHQKFGKKWKKNWFVLYPASQHGIARLEFFDSPSSGGGGSGSGAGGGANEKTRKLDKKIIRLSECISILPALTETCPKENMAAFCVETNDKTHVFAAEKSLTMEWVEKMCEIAFQGCSVSSSSVVSSNGGPQNLQMSENLIYYSREEVNEFWVSVQRTEASERCGLSGSYWLKADSESLILKDPKTKRKVLVWPYKLLRRYGRDRVMFSFEAGRRCDSGPGNFTFETKQGNEVFQLVEQAIQSQKALVEERHLNCPPNANLDLECPAPPQALRTVATSVAMTPGVGSAADGGSSGWDPDSDSGGSKPGSADGVLGKREGGDGVGGGGSGNKGRSLPEPPSLMGALGPLRCPMPRQSSGGAGKGPLPPSISSPDELAGLYSEPVDSVRLPPPKADCLYSDPVDIIQSQTPSASTPTPRLRPLGDEGSGGNSHKKEAELYTYLYDQVSVELSHKAGALALDTPGSGTRSGGRGGRGLNSNKRPPGGKGEGASAPPTPPAEHIYDEPEGCAKGGGGPTGKSASIYDEACLEPHSWRRQEEVAPPSAPEGKHGQDMLYSVLSKASDRSTQPPPTPRGPKPTTAPRPHRGVFPRKEPPLHLPAGKNISNNNNNDGNSWEGEGAGRELYSKVSKQRPPAPNLWNELHTGLRPPPALRSPDIIYDNLGDL